VFVHAGFRLVREYEDYTGAGKGHVLRKSTHGRPVITTPRHEMYLVSPVSKKPPFSEGSETSSLR
jgi:hypothetical protein